MRMCGTYSLYHLLKKINSSRFIQYFLKAKLMSDARKLQINDVATSLTVLTS